jgi:peroxin-12
MASPRLLLDSLKVLLPTAIFFIRFLEWWYSPSSPARALAAPAAPPAVPPPRLLPPAPDGITVPRGAYGACPLCTRALVNPTALPSGYVFCYRCAHAHVAAHGMCPVTRVPASVRELRKVLA